MKNLLCFLPIVLLLCCRHPEKSPVVTQDLHNNWVFSVADSMDKIFTATVPGTVHTDLMAAG
ncbi:MAG: hypothetical protein MUE71_10490, partial [Chitinophagaceae bacterium]|nr:hypothetical protein [Chitinophagaceae bacterium]